MENGNGSKFYFKIEDLKALLDSGAEHIVVNTETSTDGASNVVSLEGYTATAASTGKRPGCPWPCGGTVSAITRESLTYAKRAMDNPDATKE